MQIFSSMTIRNHFTLLAGLLLPCILAAQAPIYVRPEPPAKQSVFDIRLRYMFAPDVSFSGMGEVPHRENFVTPGNPLNGQLQKIEYDDGTVQQDITLVPGTQTGVPNTDNKTGNFSYYNESQVVNNGKELEYHRYATMSSDPNLSYAGSASSNIGWELNYTRFINRKRNLAFQMGFSFNGFDSRYNDTVTTDLEIITYSHPAVDGGTIPELPPVKEGETQKPYEGTIIRKDDGTVIAQGPNQGDGEIVTRTEHDGALVNSRMDVRSAMYNFRAGPTYSLDLGKKFSLSVGAGVSALFIDGEFRAAEKITALFPNESGEGTISIRPREEQSTVSNANDWQVGGYIDASAHWNVSERVSFFSGMQYQTGTNFNQENESRQVDIDFSSQVYMHAGFGIRF